MFTAVALMTLLTFQDAPEVKENITVSLRQIQLRVTDRDLSPVKGLKASDFVITRNDQIISPEAFFEIDYFPEGSNEAVPSDKATVAEEMNNTEIPRPQMASRNVAIFLDPGIVTPGGWQEIKAAAHDLVDAQPAGTNMSLYSMHYQLRNLVLQTGNRELIKQQIDEAAYFPDLWNKLSSLQKSIVMTVEGLGPRIHGNNQAVDTGRESLQNGVDSNTYLLGELMKFKRQVKDIHSNKFANAIGAIGNNLKPLPGERSIYVLTGGGYMDKFSLGVLKEVTSKLNWENISVHSMQFRDREDKDLNLVRMTRMTEQDIKDAHNYVMRLGLLEDNTATNSLNEDESYLKSSPRTYATETGGTFISAFNDKQVERQLERLKRGSGHFYQITYKSDADLDQIDIKLRDESNKYDLTYGRTRGNYVKRVLKDTKSEKKLDFATTLTYGYEHADVPIIWDFNWFQRADGTHVFPIQGRLTGAFPKGGFDVGMIIINNDGQIIDERKFEIKSPPKDDYLEFYDLLATNEEPMLVRAMIQAKESGDSSLGEMFLEKDDADKPGLSSLLLMPSEQHQVFAIHSLNKEKVKLGKKKVMRETLDPAFKGRGKMLPISCGPFDKGKPIGLYFFGQHLDGGIQNYDLDSYIKLGDQTYRAPLGVKVDKHQDGHAALMAQLDTSRLPLGRYVLSLRLKDKRTGATTPFSEQEFELK